MPITESLSFTNAGLKPVFNTAFKRTSIKLVPNKSFPRGVLLALQSVRNAVQTITGNTNVTSGTYQIVVFGQASDPIAFNANAATIQTALAAIPAIGSTANVGVTGGALNTSTPIVITFQGALAAQPVLPISLITTGLGGSGVSTITVVNTTIGISGQTYDIYSSSVVAAPTTTIVPSAVAGGTIPDGVYRVYYTGRNANGETTLATSSATVTLTGGSNTIRVAAMASLPAGLTNVDIYIAALGGGGGAPTFLGTAVVTTTTSASTDFTAVATAVNFKSPPTVNTAYQFPAFNASMILEYQATTNAVGGVALGANATQEHGETNETVSAFYGGDFQLADITGLDAKALNDLRGRIIAGAVGGSGILTF
jgi:hypothetical protein